MESNIFFLFTCIKDGAKFAPKLFNSLINQTKKNFVHCILDDGSTDNIDDLIKRYLQKVSQIQNPYKIIYVKNDKNLGLNLSTQKCIQMCYLPYFIWIDCDNWVDVRFFENMEITIRAKHYPDVVRSNCYYIHESTNRCNLISTKYKKNIRYKNQLLLMLSNKYVFSTFAVKYKTFLRYNPSLLLINNRSFFNDVQVLLPLLFANSKFAFSKHAYSFFYIRERSESSNFTREETMCSHNIEALQRIISYDFINDYKKYIELMCLIEKQDYYYKNNLDKECLKIIRCRRIFCKKNNIYKKCYTSKSDFYYIFFCSKIGVLLKKLFQFIKE